MFPHSPRRLELLSRWSPAQVANLLESVPALALALDDRGPLGSPWLRRPQHQQPKASLVRLADLSGTQVGVVAATAALDRIALQLLHQALWEGALLTPGQAVDAAGALRPEDLEAAAERLAALLLIDPDEGWCFPLPDVRAAVELPARSIGRWLRTDSRATLRTILERIGGDVAGTPDRRDALATAIEDLLRDPVGISQLLEHVSEDARRLFRRLVDEGDVRLRDLGIPRWPTYDRTPLHELVSSGLAAVFGDNPPYASVWLDAVVGWQGGHLYPDWLPEHVPTAALAEAPGAPSVVAHVDAVLDALAADPPQALATGGLGVTAVRALAKQLGLPAATVGLYATLLAEIGVVGHAHEGRATRARPTTPRWAPTADADRWRALTLAERWALLVQAWLDSDQIDEARGLPERVDPLRWVADASRRIERPQVVAALRELPEGAGVADLGAFLRERRTRTAHAAAGWTAVLRALGLAPSDGPVGLTRLGRAVLEGPAELAAALPVTESSFVVQADHTVIAGPDLDPAIAARLGRYAVLESDAGARVWRLSEQRIGSALADGEDGETIRAFLAEHSRVALAQNVEVFVDDAARRHGRVRAGAAASYLRSDDPGALAAALAVKAAKLRLLAPSVAVSSLPREKLVAALRAKGVSVVAENPDGQAAVIGGKVAVPISVRNPGLPDVLPATLPGPAQTAALAKSMLGA